MRSVLTATGAVALALVATWLHLRSGYTFPRPWPDEAHFLTPAIALAQDSRLAVPELNAPDGIFWVPTGYYVAQVPLLLLRVDPLVAGRLVSLTGVVTFAVGVGVTALRAGVNRGVALLAVLTWLCMPRVVATANIARMEGLVLGLVGACLALVAYDRWPLAVALSLLAPLIHPIGIVVPVAVLASSVVRAQGRRSWSRAEKLVAAVTVLLVLAQLAYFAAQADVAAPHIRFQLLRKAGRPLSLQWWQATLFISAAAGAIAASTRWRGASPALVAMWIVLAIAGALVIVDVVGREMWYESLGRETAALLVGLAAATALTRTRPSRTVARTAAVVTSLALLVTTGAALRNTLTGSWYAMQPEPASRAEWHAFTAQALSALRRVDASGTAHQLVVVDPLSGFGHEVFAQRWSRLRFVQPTPATPMDTSRADYVLTTPGAPFTTEELVQQWGAVPPAVDVRSSNGSFRMQLTANPRP